MNFNLYEPDDEERTAWQLFKNNLPNDIKLIADIFTPWNLYLLRKTNQRVIICSFSEDLSVTVFMTAQYNFPICDNRSVFGINPYDLSICNPEDYNMKFVERPI